MLKSGPEQGTRSVAASAAPATKSPPSEQLSSASTSIVIPAHNEGRVIDRCLASILDGAGPGEFEIVVVCNGCTDDTAQRARGFAPNVRVIETPVTSKTHALNLGDQNVTSFPRFYVDADIELSAAAIRDVAAMLDEKSPFVVAGPRAKVAYEDRPWGVRAFYRVWTRLPYFRENMIGSGVYAFSRKGRGRFGAFPDIIADDEFARLVATPPERCVSSKFEFTIHPPRTLAGVVTIHTRAREGNYEIRGRFPELERHNNTNPYRTMRELLVMPSLWHCVPVYIGVMLLARKRASDKRRNGSEKVWERDDTSRT